MSIMPGAELSEPESRRGPMRPRRLVSVRENQSKRQSSHVFRAVDLFALVVLTVIVGQRMAPYPLLSTPIAMVLPLVVGVAVLGWALSSMGLYRFARTQRIETHLALVLLASAGASAAVFATVGLLRLDSLRGRGMLGPSIQTSWQWCVQAAAIVFVLHTIWWLTVRVWRARGWLTPNLVIVGATEYAEQVIRDAIARRHVNVLGIFEDRLERSPKAILGVPVLGNVEALLSHRIMPFVDRIVIAVDPDATKRVREISARLSVLPNEVTLFLDPGAAPDRAKALARLEDSPLADISGGVNVERKAFAKRVQDVMIGVPLLIGFSPLIAVIAILIKLDSRGPVFFRQVRHGFNNEEINVWKFRTMRADAADAHAERQVSANDDRVTRVGRFLRKTSLDELPQLFNVLKGEMSLVGPRPHAVGMKTGEVESARLVAEYAQRHRIKPGMTGWAAINGSRGPLHAPAEVQRRVALDVDYIARQSFPLDLRIMALTVPGLLGDRHAVR